MATKDHKTHRRQHTGERPYSCLECQHHFTNWPNYNKHMKRRHGINTSHQPDPNKIALANLANAGNINNPNVVGSTTTTPPTATTLLVMRQQEQHQLPHPQQQSQSQPPETPAQHCQAILGLASDLLDHPSLPTEAPSVQYNHHPAPDTVSCVSPGTMATHSGVCVPSGDPTADQHLYQSATKSIGPTTHFYNPTPSVHVGPYVGATTVPANVLGFYNLPQLTGLEGAGPMDILPPVQQR